MAPLTGTTTGGVVALRVRKLGASPGRREHTDGVTGVRWTFISPRNERTSVRTVQRPVTGAAAIVIYAAMRHPGNVKNGDIVRRGENVNTYSAPIQEVKEQTTEVPSWFEDMEFCHITEPNSGNTFCGAGGENGFDWCEGEYTGEAICTSCGCPTCPRCAQIAALEEAVDPD